MCGRAVEKGVVLLGGDVREEGTVHGYLEVGKLRSIDRVITLRQVECGIGGWLRVNKLGGWNAPGAVFGVVVSACASMFGRKVFIVVGVVGRMSTL